MSSKKVSVTSFIVYKFYSLLGHACKGLFVLFSSGKLDPSKEVSDLKLVFFCGKKGAGMLKAVILSVYRRWEKVPVISIVTDGTDPEIIKKYMKFWPFPYQVKTYEACADFHLARGRKSLVEWARINIFARKLISILAEAEVGPTLYCDTDLLWFAEPRLPEITGGLTLRMSQDNVLSYPTQLLDALGRQDMMQKPAMNAGLLFISGSPYDHYPQFEQLIDQVKNYCVERSEERGFSEQMVFALLTDRLGDTWSPEEVIINTRDLYWPLIPSYLFSGHQFARHHVLTKHSWFWRDALFIILSKKKNSRQSGHS